MDDPNRADRCPDRHAAMKLVPNRADRRRNKRKKPQPPWTTPPQDRRELHEGIHNYDHKGLS